MRRVKPWGLVLVTACLVSCNGIPATGSPAAVPEGPTDSTQVAVAHGPSGSQAVPNAATADKGSPSNSDTLRFEWSEARLLSDESNVGAFSTKRGRGLAIDGNTLHAVWQSVGGKRIDSLYYKRSDDNGQTWTAPVRLVQGRGQLKKPIVLAGEGDVHVVWMEERDEETSEIYTKRSTDGGRTWGEDRRVTRDDTGSELPSIAADGQDVFVAFEDAGHKGKAECRVGVVRSLDRGQSWQPQVRIASDVHAAPFIGLGGGDAVHVVYASKNYAAPTRGWNWELMYRRSMDRGETWETPIRLTTDDGDSRFPVMATSGSNVHVVWWDDREDPRAHSGSPPNHPGSDHNYEIFYKRSLDDGRTWGDDIRLTNADGTSGWPSVFARGDALYLVWEDARDGAERIWFKYSTDNGDSWSEDACLTGGSGGAAKASVAVDGEGNVHAMWTDRGSGKRGAVYYKTGRLVQ